MYSTVKNKKTPQTTIQPGIYKRIAGYASRHKRKIGRASCRERV